MAFVLADRVMESSSTTGTGNITVGGAVTGFKTFASVLSTSDTTRIVIEGVDGSGNPTGEFEVCPATYVSASTLSRGTPEASSNGGSAVNFSPGNKRVWIDATASYITSAYRVGGTDVAVADGGTGASSASAARTNLGLVIGTDVKAQAPSVQSVTSAATVTPTFSDDLVKVTAQAAALALANPSGTAVPGWGWAIRIKDNGTARAISYGTQYRAIGVTLPTTTVISKTLYLGCIWNSDDSKVDVVAVAQEA